LRLIHAITIPYLLVLAQVLEKRGKKDKYYTSLKIENEILNHRNNSRNQFKKRRKKHDI
jgi:hypothetical protein